MGRHAATLLSDIKTSLLPAGLNLVGTAQAAEYDSLVPPGYRALPLFPLGKTIVVIGNGGPGFWDAFQSYCQAHPRYFDGREHPLDDYTVEMIEETLTPFLSGTGVRYRFLYPFRFPQEPISFMHLAQLAGLGGPSILGVLIHPLYGPWIALRAAVVVDEELYEPAPAPGFNPCPSCAERSCIAACPGKAVSGEKGWDIPACISHRLQREADCADLCHARYHCVYGREFRYPPEELRYHQRRSWQEMNPKNNSY